MTKYRNLLLRAVLGAGIFSCALAAQSLLSTAAAMPASPGCGFGSNAGILCGIDSNACEVWQGNDVTNACNSSTRTDGSWFHVVHRVLTVPNDQQSHPNAAFVGQGSSGTSAYATVWCSNNAQTAIFRGGMQPNQTVNCLPGGFAIRSVCGSQTVCSQY